MLINTFTLDTFLSYLKVELGTQYTQEQLELIKSFGEGPVFCFADPGTGKTHTAIAGLLTAELNKMVSGYNIYAMSFTRLATGELATRHRKACEVLGCEKRVQFGTLHAICLQILSDNYRLLGMRRFSHSKGLSFNEAHKLVEDTCVKEWGMNLTPQQIKSAIAASNSLNSALIFDKDVVVTKQAFKQCHMSYDDFERIRGLLYSFALLTENIGVGDILLYTAMLLQRHPEVSADFKSKCKLLLVDEAQDLSLLQLRIISLLTDNPIFIGDMKQQIYGFNGACQEIVEEAHKLFPGMKDLRLTQSFRCKNTIAEYATKIILPNKIGGEDYKGIGPGGEVHTICGLYKDGLDVPRLAERMHEEFIMNNNKFEHEYLFLTRTNFSLLPVIEELYKQGLPFRVNGKYRPAYEVPVVQDLCSLLQICAMPRDPRKAYALSLIIPELRAFDQSDSPYPKIMMKTGQSVFEINYNFREADIGSYVMNLLGEVSEMINNDATVTDLFNKLWPAYNKYYLIKNSWKLDNKPEYYINTVQTLCHKTYKKFLNDEIDKIAKSAEAEKYRRGIRCYTMHASKGLEADIVYIIDADDGLIPNNAKLDRLCKDGCEIDAARAIREERSLCYVACTRARNELWIIHNGEKPAPMITGENVYQDFDAILESYRGTGDDIAAFTDFTERYCSE